MFKKIIEKIQSLSRSKKIKSPKAFVPPYIGIHNGRDFLILATGPTVEKYRKEITDFIDKNNLITIGCNNICRLYHPDYHGFTNRRRFIENISAVDKEKTKVLISPYIAKWIVRKCFDGEYWPLMFTDSKVEDFMISNGIISTPYVTVALVLIGVAIIMGAENIYIAGLDGYSNYFLNNEKINCLDVETKYNSFEKNREHYLRLQRVNKHYLRQIDTNLFIKTGNHLKIITPTVYKEYYNEDILNIHGK